MMTKVVAFSETNNDTALLKMFKTLLDLLKMTGCYIGGGVSVSKRTRSKAARSARAHLYKVYCVLVNICIILYSCLMVYKLIHMKTLSSKWMKTFAISTVFTSNTLIILMTTYNFRSNRLETWMKKFCQYEELYGINKACTDIIKYARPCLITFTTLSLLLCPPLCVLLFLFPSIGSTFTTEAVPAWLDYSLTCLVWAVITVGSISFMSLIILGSICIWFEFEAITDTVKKVINFSEYTNNTAEDKHKLDVQITHVTGEPKIGDLYKQHDHVCTLMSEFSVCINHIQLVDFFVSLPLSCVMFYFLLMWTESAQDEAIAVGVMMTAFLHSVILCWAGSKVNLKAHTPLQYLWKISPSEMNETTARELIMFTTKLAGPPIGYSVYDLFTITLPASLTIASTLLTYFVVVIQFKPSDRETSEPSLDLNPLYNLTNLLQTLYNSTNTIG